jgi:oxygen-independent coproporphyrinogen-3 oxidase
MVGHKGQSNSSKPRWLWPRAAYVHVPFCAHHCNYCDFAVTAGNDHLIDLYLEALAQELMTLGQPEPVETLFIGGGTPTHLAPGQLARLLAELDRWLPLQAGCEFSIEANPGTLTEEKVRVLVEHGVNRLSLGGQSFQPEVLRVLERDHGPDDIVRAVELGKKHGVQVGLDLIFGVPGQTVNEWTDDLNRALAVGPDHLSTYGLTYEKGTRLWKQRERGELHPLDEETELAMYASAIDTLETAGFEQYEISNFARPGCRCRHNETYWANESYFGFGVGAARYVDGRRELNTRDTQGYIRKVLSGEVPTFQSESLGPEERARETMAVQLRRSRGIAKSEFQVQTGYALNAVAGESIQRLVDQRLLSDDGENIALTRRGKYVADTAIESLL